MVLVVDDLITSGRTMRLAVEAIRTAGAAVFGFAFSGV
jgi:adenine/guanine phosphoribosyltransferase-like PRPP-binding protein